MSTSTYHHGALHDALIDQAVVMLEAGATDISLRALARRAGVSAAAPYRHFADKDHLMGAVAARGFELLAMALRAGDAEADPLLGQGMAYVRFATAHPALFRLMFAGVVPACRNEYAASGAAAQAVLRSRVASEEAMLAAWALVHGLAMLIIEQRLPPLPDELIARVLNASISGGAGPRGH